MTRKRLTNALCRHFDMRPSTAEAWVDEIEANPDKLADAVWTDSLRFMHADDHRRRRSAPAQGTLASDATSSGSQQPVADTTALTPWEIENAEKIDPRVFTRRAEESVSVEEETFWCKKAAAMWALQDRLWAEAREREGG